MSRNATLDIARGLGIVLVVLGHNWIVESTKGELFRVVFSFHVPLFFFLSGVFIRAGDAWPRFALARAQALLKPYVVVLAAIGAVKLAGPDYWLGMLHGTGRTLYWIPMWFLPHLFLASLATLALVKALPSATWRGAVALTLLALGIALLAPTDWPWSADLLPISVAFMLLGSVMSARVQAMAFEVRAFALAAAAFAALHGGFDETIDLNIRHYGQPLVATAQAALGIYLCLAASAGLARFAAARRLLGSVGAASLFILIFHIFCQWKSFNLLVAAGLAPPAAALLSLAAGVMLPLLMWQLCRRVRPLRALLLPA